MKKLYLVTLLFVFNTNLNSQSYEGIELSSSVGVGLIEGHVGFSVDGAITKIKGRSNVGIFYNMMSTHKEFFPSEQDYTWNSYYAAIIEEPTGEYNRFTTRILNTIGLNFGYDLLRKKKIRINLGGGPLLGYYREKDLIIDFVQINPIISSGQTKDFDYSYQLNTRFIVDLKERLGVGLKIGFIEYHDHNLNFMVSTTVRL